MSYDSVPHSISLLFTISSLLNDNGTVLTRYHDDQALFQDAVASADTFNEQSDFIQNRVLVGHLQLLILASLSMYGGVLVPVLRQFSFEDNQFRLVWDNGIVDTFTFQVWDDSFLKFASYYINRLSSKPQPSSEIKTTLISGISNYLKSYVVILESSAKKVELLLKSKSDMLFFVKESTDRDLFFILLSSVPSQQMNALFIYVQQFFPHDLEIPMADGIRVNVCATFQTPATDVTFLIEKTKIYIDLFFNKKYPIIREITMLKGAEFLTKLLNNSDVYEATRSHLLSLKSAQLDVRLTLYRALITHLDQLNETADLSRL